MSVSITITANTNTTTTTTTTTGKPDLNWTFNEANPNPENGGFNPNPNTHTHHLNMNLIQLSIAAKQPEVALQLLKLTESSSGRDESRSIRDGSSGNSGNDALHRTSNIQKASLLAISVMYDQAMVLRHILDRYPMINLGMRCSVV